jgi:hypothetical protein
MRDSFPFRYGIIGGRTAEGKCPIDMDWMPAGYARRRMVIRPGRVDSENLKFKAIVICVFIGGRRLAENRTLMAFLCREQYENM